MLLSPVRVLPYVVTSDWMVNIWRTSFCHDKQEASRDTKIPLKQWLIFLSLSRGWLMKVIKTQRSLDVRNHQWTLSQRYKESLPITYFEVSWQRQTPSCNSALNIFDKHTVITIAAENKRYLLLNYMLIPVFVFGFSFLFNHPILKINCHNWLLL